MGKFSEMDILIQESYDRGFKDGWKNASVEAKKIIVNMLKTENKKKPRTGKWIEKKK